MRNRGSELDENVWPRAVSDGDLRGRNDGELFEGEWVLWIRDGADQVCSMHNRTSVTHDHERVDQTKQGSSVQQARLAFACGPPTSTPSTPHISHTHRKSPRRRSHLRRILPLPYHRHPCPSEPSGRRRRGRASRISCFGGRKWRRG
jgi:hypothetical protein